MICCDICGKAISILYEEQYYDLEIVGNYEYYVDNKITNHVIGKFCGSCGKDFIDKTVSLISEMKKERWVGNGTKKSD